MDRAYFRDYMKKRRQNRRKYFIQLLGGKCRNCGGTKNLEFDHINPKNKSHDYNAIEDRPMNMIETEIKKCQLLCRDCHKDKTLKNKEHIVNPARHGTLWMYKKYKCRCSACKKAMSEYYYNQLSKSHSRT